MIQVAQKLLFVHYRVHASFGDHSRFEHFFHRIQFMRLFLFYFPNFAEATTSDYVVEGEIILSNFYKIREKVR